MPIFSTFERQDLGFGAVPWTEFVEVVKNKLTAYDFSARTISAFHSSDWPCLMDVWSNQTTGNN